MNDDNREIRLIDLIHEHRQIITMVFAELADERLAVDLDERDTCAVLTALNKVFFRSTRLVARVVEDTRAAFAAQGLDTAVYFPVTVLESEEEQDLWAELYGADPQSDPEDG